MNKLPLLAALALFPSAAFAQAADPVINAPDNGAVSLSIIQATTAGNTLVVDSRPVTVPPGRARVRFGNLPAGRVEGSLQITVPAGRVLQQANVAAESGTLDLLVKSMGQRVTVRVPNQPALTGTLRQVAPYLVVENAEGAHIVASTATSFFSLDRLPPDALPRPAVEALVDGAGGAGRAELRYLTSGLNWTASYGATFIGERLALKAWVNVTNASTAGYSNAKISLPSGANDGDWVFAVPGVVDLPAGQTRSFVLADLDNAPFTSDIVWTTQSFDSADVTGRPRLTLSLKQPSPVKLPAGALTVYGETTAGEPAVINRGQLGPFDKGNDMRLALGEAPFIGLRRLVTQRRLNPKTREFVVTFTLTNTAPAPVTVRIVEPVYSESKVTQSSLPPAKSQSGNLEFLVTVPAKDNASFNYTVERPN